METASAVPSRRCVFKLATVMAVVFAAGALLIVGRAPVRLLRKSGPGSAVAAGGGAVRARWAGVYGKLPLSFEVNRGQVASEVKFLSRGSGYTLFLTGNEAVLTLQKSGARSQGSAAARLAQPPRLAAAALPGLLSLPGAIPTSQNEMPNAWDRRARPPLPLSPRRFADSGETATVLRLGLVGANSQAEDTGLEELPGKSNYFIGNDPKKWRTNVPTYARVRYKDVYPGIDLVYYGNQGQLEYDFVVAPGADPKAISLKLVGAGPVPAEGHPQGARLRIDRNGNLVLGVEGGEVRFHKPVVYQPATDHGLRTTQMLDGSYVLNGGDRVTFEVASYDKTKPLVIDPTLTYSTFLGGSGAALAAGNGIVVDSSGDAYVTGYTGSVDFPVTAGAFQTTSGGGQDAFVSKLNAAGSALLYSTYLGGSGTDQGNGIAVDGSGNAYVTGFTSSADFPVTAGAFQTTFGGAQDAFVTKLNAAGSSLLYSTYLGGSGTDQGAGIAVDGSGSAYVTGNANSGDFPVTPGGFHATSGGGYDAFVSKLNAAGSALLYSTYLGGGGDDYGNGIAIDTAGDAYVTGYTDSTDFPIIAGAFQTAFGGTEDAFASKLNAVGSALVYSTYLGGSGYDSGSGIAVDSSGDAYIAGVTASSNFPATSGAFQTTFVSAPSNAFVSKLNADGTALLYSTYLGGSSASGDSGSAIAVDGSGNAYVTGYTGSSGFPVTPNAFQTSNGGENPFVSKLNAAGSALVYSTYLGGDEQNEGNGIAIDASGSIYVTGFGRGGFPITPGAFRTLYPGNPFGWTAFVAKISAEDVLGIALAPWNLGFNNQPVGTASAAQNVQVWDAGAQPVSISSIEATGDFTQTNNCGTSVPASVGCTISVTFQPTAAGTRSGTLTINDDAPGSSQQITLTGLGTGSGATISLAPASLTFASQAVGTTSPSQQITLSNTGTAPLVLSNFNEANNADFNVVEGCGPYGGTLAAGASCHIWVTFSPIQAGSRYGAIQITDNAPGSPHIVQLSGTGTGSSAIVDFEPSLPISFAPQNVGTRSAPQTVILYDLGNAPLKIASIAASGNFAQTNNCPATLAPAATCQIMITFRPTAAGPLAGWVAITDNAPGSPQQSYVSGTGVGDPTLSNKPRLRRPPRMSRLHTSD